MVNQRTKEILAEGFGGEGKAFEFHSVTQARRQVVRGFMYDLTVEASVENTPVIIRLHLWNAEKGIYKPLLCLLEDHNNSPVPCFDVAKYSGKFLERMPSNNDNEEEYIVTNVLD